MTARKLRHYHGTPASTKVIAAVLIGVIVSCVIGTLYSWRSAPLIGWDAAAFVYVCWIWQTVWPMDARLTAEHAVREDPSRRASDVVVLAAGIASLVAVGALLLGASSSDQTTKLLLVALGVLSVVMGWLVVHTLFALRYAELYYQGKPGGVDFAGLAPSYRDFAYLAFTLGMTFQVSDTAFQTTQFRTTALRHSLISYLFGTVIVATTINLVAGLIH